MEITKEDHPMCIIMPPDIDQRLQELEKFLATPEGQRELNRWLRPVREESARLDQAARVSPEALLEPITF